MQYLKSIIRYNCIVNIFRNTRVFLFFEIGKMGMSNAERKYREKRDASPNRRREYLLKEKQKFI